MEEEEKILETNVKNLTEIVWNKKLKILFFAFLFSIIGILFSLNTKDIYSSNVVLSSSLKQDLSRNSTTSALGGSPLSSILNFNSFNRGSNDLEEALETLKSREFTKNFIKKRDILGPLIYSNGWNKNEKRLKTKGDYYDFENKKWNIPLNETPSDLIAYNNFHSKFSIERDPKTGFIKLKMNHHSPIFAKKWLDWIVEDVNELFRTKAIEKSEKALSFLNQKILETDNTNLQNSFYEYIKIETKNLMLAGIDEEYILKVIDPAHVPEFAIYPNRRIIVTIFFLIGLISSSFFYMFKFYKKAKQA